MATKIIGFEIQCSVDVYQYFEIPEDYPTENKSIEELYDEIWEYYGGDDQVNVLTEEIYAFEFEFNEMEFMNISGFNIDY